MATYRSCVELFRFVSGEDVDEVQDMIIAPCGINGIIGSCPNTILHPRTTTASPLVPEPIGSVVAGVGVVLIERVTMVKVTLEKIVRRSSEGFDEDKRTKGERFMRVIDDVIRDAPEMCSMPGSLGHLRYLASWCGGLVRSTQALRSTLDTTDQRARRLPLHRLLI